PVWQRFEGLPHAMVWSLSIDRGFTTLAVFTRSRGAWAWPLPVPSSTSADLEVSITAPAVIDRGTRLDYTVTVTNHGPNAASNVLLTNTLPAGVAFAGNSGACSTAFPCAFPSLAAGASLVIDTTACVATNYNGTDPLVLQAAASSDANDTVGSNNAVNS